jgi:hypothetical protein
MILSCIYLTDVVGLLTSISAESDYVVEGKVTKMVVLRLLDNRYYVLA